MRFLVYGAGALGQALGCMLACDGHRVDFVLRQRFVEAIHSTGLRVSGIFGEFICPPENCAVFTALAQTAGKYDYILLTTKSYDTAVSAEQLARLSGIEGTTLVSLQNGCGNLEEILKRFAPERVVGGRVISGFEISRPGQVVITVSADAIHVGDALPWQTISARARQLAESFNSAGHPCLAVADIHTSLYAKLLYNCALNPLGAILGVHYGRLAEQKSTRDIMDAVIDETFAVIKANGGTTPWPDAAGYREVFYRELIPATAGHRPSMLQDLESKKPTEVEALVGYVSRTGRQHGIGTPVCDTLAALVRYREGLSDVS
ncbi:MAG: 2-dehydropantoate 2-reductase [Deltaproteobacteria bacterium]|nr:MAG: 2-dehydropantoate 2-reductase [Deltaproteobacteria bacterium]